MRTANEVIHIDVQINNSEALSSISELIQGLQTLNITTKDVGFLIRQIGTVMQDTEGSTNNFRANIVTLSGVLNILNAGFGESGGEVRSLMNAIMSTNVATTVLSGTMTFFKTLQFFTMTAVNLLNGRITLQAAAFQVTAVAVLAVTAAVAGAVSIFNLFRNSSDEQRQETERLNGEIDRLSASLDENKRASEENARAYDQNMKAIEANAESVHNQMSQLQQLAGQEELSAAEKVKMNHLIEQLNGSVDDLNLAYDEETGLLNMTEDAMMEKVNAYLDVNDNISLLTQ